MNERKVVLDASAVLAWILKERGFETVDKLLGVAVLPVSALVETLYRAPERGHRMGPDALRTALVHLGVHIEPVTDEDSVRAAELISASRARGGDSTLSLGDGLCLAVAERLGLTVTGGDQHWSELDLRVPFLPFR